MEHKMFRGPLLLFGVIVVVTCNPLTTTLSGVDTGITTNQTNIDITTNNDTTSSGSLIIDQNSDASCHGQSASLTEHPQPFSKPCACSSPPSWQFYDIVEHLTSFNVSHVDERTVSESLDNQTRVTSYSSDPTIQFHYSVNTSQLENVHVTKQDARFERTLLGDLRNNVTLVVGINFNEHRLHSEQQIYNLEQIFKSLQEVSLRNVRFLLVNSRKSLNPRWVYELRRRVSFEVYQEMPASPLFGTLLPGNTGDIFIYDRCGLLTYHIPFPLSFIHTQQPILQAALLATYFDSPCKAKCNSSFPVSTLIQSTLYNSQQNESTPQLKANGTSFPDQDMSYSEMAQVLMKFFGQILPDTFMNRTNQNSTEAEAMNVTEVHTTVKPEVPQNPNQRSNSVLSKLREHIKSEQSECNRTVCAEWSTERLLKARLCCLNAPMTESDDPNGNGNSTESQDEQESSFGCELYARSRCGRIMPLIRCCLRNVMNKYFDFTLKMREQQQRQQSHQTSIRLDPTATSNLKSITDSASGYRIEYPADYILHHSIGSQLIPDYFKQQHRKRVFQTATSPRT